MSSCYQSNDDQDHQQPAKTMTRQRSEAANCWHLTESRLAQKSALMRRATTCKYSSSTTKVCALLIIVIATTCLAPQSNCQTQAATDCNRPRQQQQQLQQQSFRQQRQFNQRNQQAASSVAHQMGGHSVHDQQQQQRHPMNAAHEAEQEEFSLALGAANGQPLTNSNYTLLQAQQQQQPAEQQQQPVADHQNAAVTATPTRQEGSQLFSGVSNTTPSIPNDSIGSPVALQPPVTTTSSVPANGNNRASIPGPNNAVMPTTMPESGPPASQNGTIAPAQQHQQQLHDQFTTRQQQGSSRSIEDDSMSSSSRPQQQLQQQFNQREPARLEDGVAHNSLTGISQYATGTRGHMLSQPVSSSPSSISIITPLIGPPSLHQHQQQQQTHTASVTASIGGGGATTDQSTMVKPIFVVGNPLNEQDYNSNTGGSTLYDQHQQGVSENAAVSQVMMGKAPKAIDSNPQQVDALSSSNNFGGAQKSPMPKSAMESAYMQQQQQQQSQLPQQLHPAQSAVRADKGAESSATDHLVTTTAEKAANVSSSNAYGLMGERMSGPPLVYSDGHLASVLHTSGGGGTATGSDPQTGTNSSLSSNSPGQQQQQAAPRLFQGPNLGASVLGNSPRRPSLPPPVNQANAASGFRSPMSPSGPLIGGSSAAQPPMNVGASLQPPANSQAPPSASSTFYQTAPPYAGGNLVGNMFNNGQLQQSSGGGYNKPAFVLSQATIGGGGQQPPGSMQAVQQQLTQAVSLAQSQVVPAPTPGTAPGGGGGYSGRRPLNITRVEHISAECSNDLIRAVIVFNGTFKGIIYSSGYVNDPTCLYVNGTGSTRYEFSIRLNQCGTLGRQELHQPTIPGEARRRDQVMWNTLSIQYNSIIEQEWDEHFRVSCEYGSDFWKTVSFSPFNVETNTGSPVVFTINPPQCQMDVLLGHGMGPKIVDGPVTVGDPLTLLIHMKSEKAGYDILVKNCVAHNGGKQRMQLIDSNGCVVNERFISPFRGTYNDNDLRHVTLYAYLKAFRFTGSPVLYLECEIHMCQSACPPQMCYWRRLSKRSVDDFDYEYTTNSSNSKLVNDEQPVISDSLNLFKALQVRQESEPSKARQQQQHVRDVYAEDNEAALVCYRHAEVFIFLSTIGALLMLVITIAVTCCLRIRKLTKMASKQWPHIIY